MSIFGVLRTYNQDVVANAKDALGHGSDAKGEGEGKGVDTDSSWFHESFNKVAKGEMEHDDFVEDIREKYGVSRDEAVNAIEDHAYSRSKK